MRTELDDFSHRNESNNKAKQCTTTAGSKQTQSFFAGNSGSAHLMFQTWKKAPEAPWNGSAEPSRDHKARIIWCRDWLTLMCAHTHTHTQTCGHHGNMNRQTALVCYVFSAGERRCFSKYAALCVWLKQTYLFFSCETWGPHVHTEFSIEFFLPIVCYSAFSPLRKFLHFCADMKDLCMLEHCWIWGI